MGKVGIGFSIIFMISSGFVQHFADEWENARISQNTNVLIQALTNRDRSQAEEVLAEINTPFNAAERIAVMQAVDRLSPGADWIPFLIKLAEKNQPDGDFVFLTARAYWRAGDTESAMNECAIAIKQSPDNQRLLYRAAALAHSVDRIELAKTWINQLLQMDPEHADGLFLLGRIQASQGEDDAAKKTLEHVVRLNPKHYLSQYELGRLGNRTGDAAMAEQHLKAAVHGYPFFLEAYNALLIALARQKKMDELETYKKYATYIKQWDTSKINRLRTGFQAPESLTVKDSYEMAVEFCKVGREDLAVSLIEWLMKNNKTAEPHLILLAQLRYRQKQYEECVNLLEQVKNTNLRATETFTILYAWSLFLAGNVEESRAFYQTISDQYKETESLRELVKAFAQKAPSASAASATETQIPAHGFQFADVTEQAGLSSFKHRLGNPDKRWIVDAMGSGVAVGDYDNDGDDDIYFVNGRPDIHNPDPEWRNALFRNDGGIFTNVTESAGVGDTGFGMCALFGDINNDGWLDLFVGNYGANALYKNNGDGTFTNITQQAGVGDKGYAASAAFADVDRDGDLDLYVGNYVAFDPERDGDKRDGYHGMKVFAGPLAFGNQKDILYSNNGAGVFTDVSEKANINVSPGRAMGTVFFDFDNDGDLDLYVTNDSTYNHMLSNQGDGTFKDISFESGGAFTENGVEGASMGVITGDYNNDGWLDLFVTSYEQQSDVLYKNDGKGFLIDSTSPSGLYGPSKMLITWGGLFCDFNADGFLDIFTANGHLYPQVESMGVNRSYNQGVSFYQNNGQRFTDITSTVRLDPFKPKGGRGAALLDYDNDGDMDIIINCVDDSPQLLENRSNHGHWLQVDLKANSAQTFGVRVVAKKGNQRWTRTVDGGSGYLSQSSSILHFGFGSIDEIDEFTIHWFHREPQVIPSPKLDQRIQISPLD